MSKRTRTIQWEAPQTSSRDTQNISGLDYLCALREGRIAPPPAARLVGYHIVNVDTGQAVFELNPFSDSGPSRKSLTWVGLKYKIPRIGGFYIFRISAPDYVSDTSPAESASSTVAPAIFFRFSKRARYSSSSRWDSFFDSSGKLFFREA